MQIARCASPRLKMSLGYSRARLIVASG